MERARSVRSELLPDGRLAKEFVLEDGCGTELRATDLGATLTSLRVPDGEGSAREVVLGYERLASYAVPRFYFGATVGRVAGRIPGGRFTLDGRTFELPRNEGTNHLHGGPGGLTARLWSADFSGDRPELVFRYESPDGEEGYPGAVAFVVRYSFSGPGKLRVEWEATADRRTPASLTHHSYFNLGDSSDALDHEVQIFADSYFPVDADFAPMPEARPVEGGGPDLRRTKTVGEVVGKPQDRHGDFYLLPGIGDRRAARLACPSSGLEMVVFTDEPCLQFYTGEGLSGSAGEERSGRHGAFAGVCMECQCHPGAVGHAGYGPWILEPGRTLRRETRYEFSALKPS